MLSVSHLAYGYGRRQVLRDVSFSLNAGESIALLGANGSGKSTLMRLLLGILRPQHGEIRLDNRPLHQLPNRERAHRMAYVPQDHGVAFPFRVREVVDMGRLPHRNLTGRVSNKDRRHTDAALDRLGIIDLAERNYTELSGGQRQLVLIARALAQGASILILDEPVTGLDYGNQHRLNTHIRDLANSGYSILQSTHYPEHALAAASRVILLQEGRILADGPAGTTISAEHLRALYAIETEIIDLGDGRRSIHPLMPPAGQQKEADLSYSTTSLKKD